MATAIVSSTIMLFFISLDIFYKGDDFSTISFVRFFQIFAHFFTEGQKTKLKRAVFLSIKGF
jgi:hypothetical protein